jgi:uncharacterized membrane protein
MVIMVILIIMAIMIIMVNNLGKIKDRERDLNVNTSPNKDPSAVDNSII